MTTKTATIPRYLTEEEIQRYSVIRYADQDAIARSIRKEIPCSLSSVRDVLKGIMSIKSERSIRILKEADRMLKAKKQ
jgi:hypothetical protein